MSRRDAEEGGQDVKFVSIQSISLTFLGTA